jgi:hypothetical protein
LLFDREDRKKQTQLDSVADQIKEHFCIDAIRRGARLEPDGKTKPG